MLLSNIEQFRKILKSRKVPFYFVPKITDIADINKIYKFTSVPIQRKLPGKKIEDCPVTIISKQLQLKILKELFKLQYPFIPYVIGFSSIPSDIFAMELVGTILYKFWENRKSVNMKIKNAAFINFKDEAQDYIDVDILVVYNLTPRSSDVRLQLVRDYIMAYNRSLRFIINAGTSAIEFFDNYLYHGLSGMVHLVGNKERYYNFKDLKPDKRKDYERAVTIFSAEVEDFLN